MIICPFCNKQFKSLMSHLKVHKCTIKSFRKKYPLLPLVSEDTKNLASNTCKLNNVGTWRKGSKLTIEQCRAVSKRVRGKKNPFYGKKHTTETKQKMKDNHADFTGKNNPFKQWLLEDKNNIIKYKKICKNKWKKFKKNKQKYNAFRNKRSVITSQQIINGDIKSYGRGHKNGWYLSKKFNNKYYYRSSWELTFIKECEQNKNVVNLESCKFTVCYYDEHNILRRTIPDFIVNTKTIIEIKPSKQLIYNKRNKLKIKAIKKYCRINNMTFQLITEIEMKNLSKNIKIL